MGFTLDFTHGPDEFFDSLFDTTGSLVSGATGVLGKGLGSGLGGLFDGIGTPLLIAGGAVVLIMLLKK